MKRPYPFYFALALLLTTIQTPAQTPDSLKSPLQITDIYNMELVENPQISPDGS